jgi:uncharacterized membrane protein YjgN (DUF898 family)
MLDHVAADPADDFGAPASPPATIRHNPEFSGRVGEYFGIWFVNLLLSIVTLGIYSAWAKVRTERYFYGNTRLAGASFDYLASPIAILKGRLIAYAVVIAMGLSSRFSPALYAVLLLAVVVAMPALIVLGLRFRARSSAWRGVSFRFDGGIPEAYGPFMGWPLLSSLTLSLLYPVMTMRQHAFLAEGHRFGAKRFTFKGDTGAYYVPYLIAAAICIGAVMAFFGLMVVFAAAAGSGEPGTGVAAAMVAGMVLLYAGMIAAGIFMRVRYTNMLWNNTRIGAHRFESTLRTRDMLWIYFSNTVAIVCTIGLAVPWAMVRLARYRAEHFSLLATGSIDDFFAASESRPGSLGEEMVDALDVGIELGI